MELPSRQPGQPPPNFQARTPVAAVGPASETSAPQGRGEPASPQQSSGRRGGGPRLLLAAVLVLATLVGADRLAAFLATRSLAKHVESAQHLAARPGAAIRGFPFLTQVLTGRYREVDLATRAPVTEQGVRISAAQVRLRGVAVGLSDMLHGTVADVPVRSGSGTALLTYSDLNRLAQLNGAGAGAAVTFASAGPGRVRVTGPFGLSITTAASVVNGQLHLSPDTQEFNALPAALRDLAAGLLAGPLPLPPLPFNVTIRSGTFNQQGLKIEANADGGVFPTRR